MQYSRLLAIAAVLGLVAGGPWHPAFADTRHSHASASSSRVRTSSAGDFRSISQAWTTIKSSFESCARLISVDNPRFILANTPILDAAINYLQGAGGIADSDKRARAEAILKQLFALSGELHDAARAQDTKKSAEILKNFETALKLLEVQYPAEELSTHLGTGDLGEGHVMAASVATTKMSLTTATPLVVGEATTVTVKLSTPDGKPMLLSDLKEMHTEKIHLLINDLSLSDYHHEHPVPTATPGEYQFTFTPSKPGRYRVWADLVPIATDIQEYAIGDISASTKSAAMTNRTSRTAVEIDGLKYEIAFDPPALIAGKAALGRLLITTPDGAIFTQLEPVMGAFAHIVGFSEDLQSIAHIHPMGIEPESPADRGAGELSFHLLPAVPGLMRLYAQVRINGRDKFAPFTLEIQP